MSFADRLNGLFSIQLLLGVKKRRCSHAYEEHYIRCLVDKSFRELSALDQLDTNNVRLLAAEYEHAVHFTI